MVSALPDGCRAASLPQEPPMSVFAFVDITVKDQEMYARYMEEVPAVIAAHGGVYVVRSSKVFPVSGGWQPDRMIVIAFPTLENLRQCFGSPEYKTLAALREHATVTRSIVVEGDA